MADEILSNASSLAYSEDINPSDFKIMVVDDTPANVMLLRMQLSKMGYNVVSCEDSVQVHTICLIEKPDLILQDVQMPKMSGFDVARALKSDPKTADIPIIFLTAYADKEHTLEGFASGGSDYVAKPFEKEVLIARLNAQLKLTSARRAILERNENLKNTLTSRDRMYSVIAHDLRGPLGVVQMSLKALTDILSPEMIGQDFNDMLSECNKQVSELFNLLDNLLKWTKSQTGSLKIVYQDFPAMHLVESMRDIYSSVAALKKINFVVEDVDPNIIVHSDSDMCQTILRNLLSNAIKFTEPGKQVKLYVRVEGKKAIFYVQDEGKGMSKDELKLLFHSNTHFTTYGTAREEGSGLGLMLCKSFIEILNGVMKIDSSPGKGSIFSVYVPLAKN